MNLNQSRRIRSCLVRCVTTALLTTTAASSAFINKAEATHCGFLDFTGNCIHEDTGSEIGGGLVKNPRPTYSLNLVLDANNGAGNLYLHPKVDPTNRNHLWTKTSIRGDGYFMLTSKRNGYVLDANGGTGNLYLNPNPDSKNPNHYWRLTSTPIRGAYMITSSVNGYVLDANGGTGNLYLNPNPDKANRNHLWKTIEVGNSIAIGSSLKN